MVMEDHEKLPVGWTKSSSHIIFDIKMGITRKVRWVKDGHKYPDSKSSNYIDVVLRKSVRIALIYAASNKLNVLAAGISKSYCKAPLSDRHFTICGPEFGLENQGEQAKTMRVIYRGETARRDF